MRQRAKNFLKELETIQETNSSVSNDEKFSINLPEIDIFAGGTFEEHVFCATTCASSISSPSGSKSPESYSA